MLKQGAYKEKKIFTFDFTLGYSQLSRPKGEKYAVDQRTRTKRKFVLVLWSRKKAEDHYTPSTYRL